MDSEVTLDCVGLGPGLIFHRAQLISRIRRTQRWCYEIRLYCTKSQTRLAIGYGRGGRNGNNESRYLTFRYLEICVQ